MEADPLPCFNRLAKGSQRHLLHGHHSLLSATLTADVLFTHTQTVAYNLCNFVSLSELHVQSGTNANHLRFVAKVV